MPSSNSRRWLSLAAFASALAAPFFLAGCNMTPEDKAFYGRGWIDPDELDREEPPPHAFQDQYNSNPATAPATSEDQ